MKLCPPFFFCVFFLKKDVFLFKDILPGYSSIKVQGVFQAMKSYACVDAGPWDGIFWPRQCRRSRKVFGRSKTSWTLGMKFPYEHPNPHMLHVWNIYLHLV